MGTCLRRVRDGGKRLNPHEASERCPNNARSRGSLQGALTTFTSWRDRAGEGQRTGFARHARWPHAPCYRSAYPAATGLRRPA